MVLWLLDLDCSAEVHFTAIFPLRNGKVFVIGGSLTPFTFRPWAGGGNKTFTAYIFRKKLIEETSFQTEEKNKYDIFDTHTVCQGLSCSCLCWVKEGFATSHPL